MNIKRRMYQGDLRAPGLLINGPGDFRQQPRRNAGHFVLTWDENGV